MVRSFMRLLLTRLALVCATAIEGIAAGKGVAVCVAGQARTLNASAVYRNIHESMVRPLRDARHRVDVFLALAPTEGPGFDYANNPLAPELVARLRPVALDWASVDQNKPAPEVCDARCGIWGMGCKGLGQTTHQEACLRDIERRERLVGKRYAWVLLGRPDVATGRTLTPEALRAAAGAAASVTSRNGTVFSRPGRCHAEAYCRSDTWALATRRAADVYVHAMAREFRRRTGCADARRAIVSDQFPPDRKNSANYFCIKISTKRFSFCTNREISSSYVSNTYDPRKNSSMSKSYARDKLRSSAANPSAL